ncbi:MAG TPA: DsbC family protein [Rhodoferax sp.]|mgnify:CR=1 FL=1|jgi:thiol:disulfide interchange protein DsbC|nr:DsbC family protein [Rhodoferax sp.]HOF50668.1 DsbC family protein [Rhodoferax sp.]HPW83828.1 DsbC family protein [Rhodoferax sp.]HQC84918.1 DsbC family protein [Rhodoferax sp.]HQY76300.1 DsbC family protein [Rhodoferax sp.]
MISRFFPALLGTTLAMAALGAGAQEAVIRKNLAERVPQLKAIDEVTKSVIPGLYEIRVNGTEIYYSDAQANYLVQGNIIDVRNRRNLTEERVDKLTAIKFDALPLKDAFTIVRGNGKRKLAVFEDPNCGYCKRFERDLQKVDNVTIHMFLYPILGADSAEKSKAIWCAKDKTAAWQDWMVRDQAPPSAAAMCDTSALARNVELGRAYKITGTPTLVFVNGSRVPGAIDAKQVEKHLAEAQP